MNPQDIIHFWFNELGPERWFAKDQKLDELITRRFLSIHHKAAQCELSSWRTTAEGRLAEIIILDQFSRNIFRNDPKAFVTDPLALGLAQEAIHNKSHFELTSTQRAFLYMPFMHSESIAIHQTAMQLFSEPGLESNLKFEILHFDIIKKYGRYPHRNKILGRESTPDEIAFLKTEGSSF